MQIRDRQTALRREQFVGRAAEFDRVDAALAGRGPQVLLVHAPGGVGKSTLLLELAARNPKATYIDARELDPQPSAIERAFAAALRAGPALLLLDTVEQLAPLDGWLRETFIPSLPASAVVVLAGRTPPSAAWRALPGWGTLLCEVPLGPLSDAEARALLKRNGVPPTRHAEVLAFTRGHPLALRLAADALASDPRLSLASGPPPDLVRALLAQVVTRVPNDAHRKALEAAATVRALTEPLLATLLDEADVHDRFEWLAERSFITAGPRGLFPHDLIRELIEADLRWRNPELHSTLVGRAHAHYFRRMEAAGDEERHRLALDWLFLHRHSPLFGGAVDWETTHNQRIDLAQPSDERAIRALVARHEGPEAADLAAYWLRRQPDLFWVFRDEKPDLAGLVLVLWLEKMTPADAKVDPGARAALRMLKQLGSLRTGERAGLLRAWMAREEYQRRSPIHAWMMGLALRLGATTPSARYNVTALADPEYWSQSLRGAGNTAMGQFEVGGRRYALTIVDHRAIRPIDFLASMLGVGKTAVPRVPSEVVRLQRPAFARAVRLALKRLTDPVALAAVPLVDARLVWTRVDPDTDRSARALSLAALLAETIVALDGSPRGDRARRVLHRTFVEPAPVQKQAAAELKMPWSSYRRYLAEGTAMVVDRLWRRETES